jgi:hypothetical protein
LEKIVRLRRVIHGRYGLLILVLIPKLFFLTAWFAASQWGESPTNCNWDCRWYLTIINSGYQQFPNSTPPIGQANWAFFPFMPILVNTIHSIFQINPVLLGIIINLIAFYFALVYLEKILLLDKEFARYCSALIAVSPLSIYINTLYTESLYFAATIMLSYFLKERKYRQAIITMAAISATKVTGIILSFVTFAYLINARRNREISLKGLWIGGAASFSGLIAFSVFLRNRTGDPLAFLHIQAAWGVGNQNFGGWLRKVFTFESPTTLVYFMLLLLTFFCGVRLLQKKYYFEGILTLIPVVTTVFSAAINFRYFLVSYGVYFYICKFADSRNFRRLFFLFCVSTGTLILEYAWLIRAGFMI